MMTYRIAMPRATLPYLVLAVLAACALANQAEQTLFQVQSLRHTGDFPAEPFPLQVGTRSIGGGPLRGDQVLAIDGRPLTGYFRYREFVAARHPGDKLLLTLSEPSGRAVERTVTIPRSDNFDSTANIALSLCLNILVPIAAMALGFAAVAIRPRDGLAWLLLFLMMGFSEMARPSHWRGRFEDLAAVWSSIWNASWAVLMMLFGIYFPSRLALDRRRPWMKYLVILPTIAVEVCFWSIIFIWNHNINAALPFRSLFGKLYFGKMVVGMAAIGIFFACLGAKTGTEPSADGRRRLRILLYGASVSLTPMFALVLYSIYRDADLFRYVPWPIIVTALFALALFPLTLGYVIVVERAMDLRFVIRQSLQYGLARVGLFVARASLLSLAVYLFSTAASSRGTAAQPIELTTVGLGLIVLRKRTADRASQWIDRKFFREAYDSERVLHELATEAGRYVQIQPLLEKVARRISDTMHVPDIVILVRESDWYIPRYSTRPGEPMNIAAEGRIAKNLRARNEALEIYFDKPPLWILSLDAHELQTLDFMRTQLLLPLTGQDQLAGMLSLGPKLSEAPYSDTDIRLLQAVASQMGLALENSRLVISLAAAAAEKERANTELEIAREVQERLFPQNYPAFPVSIARAIAVPRAASAATITISCNWRMTGSALRSATYRGRESRQPC